MAIIHFNDDFLICIPCMFLASTLLIKINLREERLFIENSSWTNYYV